LVAHGPRVRRSGGGRGRQSRPGRPVGDWASRGSGGPSWPARPGQGSRRGPGVWGPWVVSTEPGNDARPATTDSDGDYIGRPSPASWVDYAESANRAGGPLSPGRDGRRSGADRRQPRAVRDFQSLHRPP